MDDDLEQLYQDIILSHSKRPRNEGELNPNTGQAEGYNPTCGDRVTVFLRENEGKLAEVTFLGEACSIARASASIMTGLLKGLSPEEAHAKAKEFYELLTSAEAPKVDLDVLGDLVALVGVRKFPARIKCATLAWHTMEDALRK